MAHQKMRQNHHLNLIAYYTDPNFALKVPEHHLFFYQKIALILTL